MKICGIKLTHDGAVAGIEDGKLLFCVEAEKIGNNPRYSRIDDLSIVKSILQQFEFTPDRFVVDGWKHGKIPLHNLPVSSYHDHDNEMITNLAERIGFGIPYSQRTGFMDIYESYPHMTGHIFSAYCTAPFSADCEDAYVITWDGGQNPRVHFVSPRHHQVAYVRSLFDMYGVIYGIMGRYFGPYKVEGIESMAIEDIPLNIRFGGYDVPGKIMSYIGSGVVNDKLLTSLMGHYYNLSISVHRDDNYHQDGVLEHLFMRKVLEEANANYPFLMDTDVLATIHQWLEIMLVENAVAAIPAGSNLAFVGGSALNIKWNTALRETGHFKTVWVPPFPNDSGSAIGQACAYMALVENIWSLDWSVYCGLPMDDDAPPIDGWSVSPCSLENLAGFFAAHPEEPVVFLNGRTEVGPRALGNRSILMSAHKATNKDVINEIKGREGFRPVAPICLEECAAEIFDPGTPDPYMLFDHMVRPSWRSRVPAIVHLDGSARLQTVNEAQNADVYELLSHYDDLTGTPLLCNTSANRNGSGFFPDVRSAMEWGEVKRIWSNGLMYVKGD